MTDFKIGDRVRDASGFFARCYNKPDVEGVIKVRNACGGWEIDWDGIVGGRVNWGNNEIELVVSRDDITGPVTIETVKRINPGIHGRLKVTGALSDCVEIGFAPGDENSREKLIINGSVVLTIPELTAMITNLTAIRDALEGE